MRPEDELQKQSLQPLAGTKETVREQDKIMLILAYLGIFALIPLLTVKDSPFVSWHAKQGLSLSVIALAVSLLSGVIPLLGLLLACPVVVGWVVASIMGIVKSLAGERWRIPLVADLADKF